MKLNLEDCFSLIRTRIERLNVVNEALTTGFWKEMVELSTEGLERAKEHEAADKTRNG